MILFVILALVGLPGLASAQCNYYQSMAVGATYQIFSPGYSNYYTAGLNCQWQAVAPSGYKIVLDCPEVNIPVSSGCSSDALSVSLTGSTSTSGDNVYCGVGTLSTTSVSNALTLRLRTYTYSGRFYCTIKTQLDPCQCGRRNLARIVRDPPTFAGVNEFTPMVRIESSGGSLLCGGAIISEYYILTAAHCVAGQTTGTIRIKVGEHDVSTTADTPYTAIYSVGSIVSHGSYNPTGQKNDIALIKTSSPITFNAGVGLACLPFKYNSPLQSFAGYTIDVAGWGTTSFGGPISSELRKVTLNVITSSSCASSSSTYSNVDSTQICTYTQGLDSCQYDSGGNLFFTDGTGRMYTVGVTSYGTGCAGSLPSVSTRTTSYLTWILNNAAGASFCNI